MPRLSPAAPTSWARAYRMPLPSSVRIVHSVFHGPPPTHPPCPHLASGVCRTGARSLPFPTLLEGGAYKPAPALAAAFAAAGLDPSQPVVGSCGSGLTACILALALYQVNGSLVRGGGGEWGLGGGWLGAVGVRGGRERAVGVGG